MNRHTLEELNELIANALTVSDMSVLPQYAAELELIGSKEATAARERVMGIVTSAQGNNALALEHFDRALRVFEEIGDRTGIASIHANIGSIHSNRGDYDQALEMYRRSIVLFEQAGDRKSLGAIYGSIGIIYAVTGNSAEALEHFNRALDLNIEFDQRNGIAGVTCNIGNLYKFACNYPEALEHYHRALAELEILGNRKFMANVLLNMGGAYDQVGDHANGLEYNRRALAVYEEIDNPSGTAYAMGNIGHILLRIGAHDEALAHLRKARDMYLQLDERRGLAFVISSTINTLSAMGSWDEAEAMLKELDALPIDEPLTFSFREVHWAEIHKHHERFDDAARVLRSALAYAQEHTLPSQLSTIHRLLRDLAMSQNDLAAYVEHNNHFTRINEEINGRETATKLAMLEAERRIAAERQEHNKYLAVLHSTLPKHIADRVARGEVVNDQFDNAAVIFLDVVGFTTLSDQLTSDQVVGFLDTMFTTLDAVCKKHDVVKIKTIGDSYMAVAFPRSSPSARNDSLTLRSSSEEDVIPSATRNTAVRAANAALEMLYAVSHIVSPASSDECSPVRVRIGIHSGTLTAGVIGTERLQYDVWGDTVNVASRMESSGEPGRIHVSEAFASFLVPHFVRNDNTILEDIDGRDVIPSTTRNEEPGTWHVAPRGEIEIKGKGTMKTYWLSEIQHHS